MSADLIFADPPFNIGYEYDQHIDKMSPADYLNWTWNWTEAAVASLAPTGSLFVAIGDEQAAMVKQLLDSKPGLHWRNWIVWHYTFGVHLTRKFGRDHAHILYYTADPKRFTFNADAIRVPSARQTKYNDKRSNPKGRVPGDVWQFPRVCGTFKERTQHPCQMPVALLERIVLACSNPVDVVLDPFCGSGTTIEAAVKHGRRAIGYELSPCYAQAARERVAKLEG